MGEWWVDRFSAWAGGMMGVRGRIVEALDVFRAGRRVDEDGRYVERIEGKAPRKEVAL